MKSYNDVYASILQNMLYYIMGGWVRQHLLGHDPLFLFSREAVKHGTTLKFTSLSIELDSHACQGAGRA